MANPAELLHQQLKTWANSNRETVQDKRGLTDKDSAPAVWKQHRIAVQLLNDVEDALTMAEQRGTNVTVFKQFIPAWTAAIFAFPNGWNGGNSPAITKVPLDQLASAAAVLSAVVPSFEPQSGKDDFHNFLVVLAHEVHQLSDEHKFLREHALRVIRHLKGCFDDVEIYGEFQLINALAELRTILEALNEATKSENTFFRKAKDGAWSFFTKTGVIALATLDIATIGAISAAGEDFYHELVAPELPQAFESAVEVGLSPKELLPDEED